MKNYRTELLAYVYIYLKQTNKQNIKQYTILAKNYSSNNTLQL